MIPDRWIDEACAELESWGWQPFLVPFLSTWGIDRFPRLRRTIAEVRRCLLDPGHPLRLADLAAALDEWKSNGRQVVFLWRLRPGEEGTLAELAARHPDRSDLVWEAGVPVLAAVRRRGTSLRFQWVATRLYFVPLEPPAEGRPPDFAPRTQRAVTFLTVDLATGDLELRLPSLPDGGGLPSPREEFERYRAEAAKVVDLDRFVPVPVAPVAEEWLREPPRGLATTHWSVVLRDGRHLTGGGGAGILTQLKLGLAEALPRRVTLRWDCKQQTAGHPLYVTLDATAGCADFNGRADAARIDYLLDRIRRHAPPALRLRELHRLAAEHPELARIFAAIDRRLAARGASRIAAGEIAADLWTDPAEIDRAFALAERRFPRIFRREGGDLVRLRRGSVVEVGLVGALLQHAAARGHRLVSVLVHPLAAALSVVAPFLYKSLLDWSFSWLFQNLTGAPWELAKVAAVVPLMALQLTALYGGDGWQAAARFFLGLSGVVARRLETLSRRQQKFLADRLERLFATWAARHRPVPDALPAPGAPAPPTPHPSPRGRAGDRATRPAASRSTKRRARKDVGRKAS